MKSIKRILTTGLSLMILLTFSCEDHLTELNINPNGTTPDDVNPAFLMTYVQTEMAKEYLKLNYGESGYFGPLMQQVQLDSHSKKYNDYQWSDQSWSELYAMLRNNETAYQRAEENEDTFIMGVSLTLKSYIYGLITDLWGDAPYSSALQGDLGGDDNMYPPYDDQESIYRGIIEDLQTASGLFETATPRIDKEDVFYQGDVEKWQKLSNSLLLRYYMRISSKLPELAQTGVEDIVASGIYFKDENDDATMDFLGTKEEDSWPGNLEYDRTSGTNYRRVKMSSVFVDTLESYGDPRLEIWASKVEIPISFDETMSSNPDTIIDGVRYIHEHTIPEGTLVDTSSHYVGIPPSIGNEPSWYNLNPTPGQEVFNPHVSYLHERYQKPSGDLLKVRLISAAEVDFILAEAALKGWNVNDDAETWYNKGVRASLEAWELGGFYDQYIAGPRVAFDGTLEQVITQKWIASWTSPVEAWMDYRRTGYPALQAGPEAERNRLPVRFVYSSEELNLNSKNIQKALDALEETNFSGAQGKNSPWSKPWLLQGTGKPW